MSHTTLPSLIVKVCGIQRDGAKANKVKKISLEKNIIISVAGIVTQKTNLIASFK